MSRFVCILTAMVLVFSASADPQTVALMINIKGSNHTYQPGENLGDPIGLYVNEKTPFHILVEKNGPGEGFFDVGDDPFFNIIGLGVDVVKETGNLYVTVPDHEEYGTIYVFFGVDPNVKEKDLKDSDFYDYVSVQHIPIKNLGKRE